MSKNHQLNLSPNKIYTPKNMTNLNLNPSQYFSHKNKSEHILINSDRNSTEKREEILAQKKKYLIQHFMKKIQKKQVLIATRIYRLLIIRKVMKDINSQVHFIKQIKML